MCFDLLKPFSMAFNLPKNKIQSLYIDFTFMLPESELGLTVGGGGGGE